MIRTTKHTQESYLLPFLWPIHWGQLLLNTKDQIPVKTVCYAPDITWRLNHPHVLVQTCVCVCDVTAFTHVPFTLNLIVNVSPLIYLNISEAGQWIVWGMDGANERLLFVREFCLSVGNFFFELKNNEKQYHRFTESKWLLKAVVCFIFNSMLPGLKETHKELQRSDSELSVSFY